MKLSGIINSFLGLLGARLVRSSRPWKESLPGDIAADKEFIELFEKVRPFSIVEPERAYALYQSLRYILRNKIPGDIVECGVWKGGSCMLAAHCLLKYNDTSRRIWLYDTFTGMTQPGLHDGEQEKNEWQQKRTGDDSSNWCLASREEVKANMESTGYPSSLLELVKGKVEETIPGRIPAKIALLRLDTDWYESTKHELEQLYPLLEKGGVLIIDDYGAWQGARKATDEYFGDRVLLNRLDFTGRLIIK